MVESLMTPAPAPRTPARTEQRAANDGAHDRAWEKYLYDTEHDRITPERQEEARARERESEY